MKTKKTTKSSKKQVKVTAATKAAPAVASPIHEYVDSHRPRIQPGPILY